MGLAIFYETLLVILVSALTAAVCLSSYLVTKRKTMLFACIAFMFYFFDVASILQDDYAARELASGLTQEYYFIRSLYTMVTGAAFSAPSGSWSASTSASAVAASASRPSSFMPPFR